MLIDSLETNCSEIVNEILTCSFKKMLLKISRLHLDHYSDVIMGAMASQIISLTVVYLNVYSAAQNIKPPRHWPLCREFTGDRWISHTNGQ